MRDDIKKHIKDAEENLRRMKRVLDRYPDATVQERVDGREVFMSMMAAKDCNEVQVVVASSGRKEPEPYVYAYVKLDDDLYVFAGGYPKLSYSTLKKLLDENPVAYLALVKAAIKP